MVKNYQYKTIMECTGKSLTTVKRWRREIERISGYHFKRVRERVSYNRTVDRYYFTEDELDDFIILSALVDETKNLEQSIIAIWGNLKQKKAQEHKKMIDNLVTSHRQLLKRVAQLDNEIHIAKQRLSILERLEQVVKDYEERLSALENKRLFKKKKINNMR